MNTNRSHHIPLLMFAVLTTAIAATLYLFMQHALASSIDSALQARAAVVEGQSQVQGEKRIADIYAATAADRQRLPAFFVPSDDAVAFIESIEALGKLAGGTVTLASIGPDATVPTIDGTAGNIRAHVSAHGSWEAMMKVISLAEKLPYLSSLDNVSLDASMGASGPSREWNLSFDVIAVTLSPS